MAENPKTRLWMVPQESVAKNRIDRRAGEASGFRDCGDFFTLRSQSPDHRDLLGRGPDSTAPDRTSPAETLVLINDRL